MGEGPSRLLRMSAPVAAAAAGDRRGRLLLDGALKAALGPELPARLRRHGAAAELTARLGRAAPPGRHEVTLVTGAGERTALVVEVPERRRLRISPASFDVAAPLGGVVERAATIANRGNVPAELPPSGIAGAFASDGVAGAFSRAYAVDSDDPQEIFGAFVLGLRASHLGLMRLSLQGLDGPIPPGESVAVTVRIALPKPGRGAAPGPGRRYHATFALGEARITVRLTVARAEEEPK